MSAGSFNRLRAAFGEVVLRHRLKRKLSAQALADASGLSINSDIIIGLESGDLGPRLTDFFQFAQALRIDPVLLFVDLVTAWRTNPLDRGLVKSRPSDLMRLYRLGYSIDPGEFRELSTVYGTEELALHAAAGLNITRVAKGQPGIDALVTYVRLVWQAFPTPTR